MYLSRELFTKAVRFARITVDTAWSKVGNISIRGVQYDNGIGVHADSAIEINLDHQYKSFHVTSEADDGHDGTLVMRILIDGEEAYTSGPISSIDDGKPERVSLKLEGKATLTLLVEQSGEQGSDHASWADAYLLPLRSC